MTEQTPLPPRRSFCSSSTRVPREQPEVTSTQDGDAAVDIMLAELDLLEELAADELKQAPGAARRQWAAQQLSLKG